MLSQKLCVFRDLGGDLQLFEVDLRMQSLQMGCVLHLLEADNGSIFGEEALFDLGHHHRCLLGQISATLCLPPPNIYFEFAFGFRYLG